jgi:hypothetical protein
MPRRLQVVAALTETVTVLETLQIQRQDALCVDAEAVTATGPASFYLVERGISHAGIHQLVPAPRWQPGCTGRDNVLHRKGRPAGGRLRSAVLGQRIRPA